VEEEEKKLTSKKDETVCTNGSVRSGDPHLNPITSPSINIPIRINLNTIRYTAIDICQYPSVFENVCYGVDVECVTVVTSILVGEART
jgi:hypothetical protein